MAYAIEEGQVVLTRLEERPAAEDTFATFSEWSSEADRKAYRGL